VSAAVYDYVVVGAGSAGCAVAARLAAASHTVLLIEAGGSDRRIPVRAPLAYGAQMGRPQSEMVAALDASSFREIDQQPDGGGRAHSFSAGFGRAGLPADPRTDLCPAGRDQLSTAGVVDLAVILDAREPRQCDG
jgi:choline dehydrogenase-like flavoprotein